MWLLFTHYFLHYWVAVIQKNGYCCGFIVFQFIYAIARCYHRPFKVSFDLIATALNPYFVYKSMAMLNLCVQSTMLIDCLCLRSPTSYSCIQNENYAYGIESPPPKKKLSSNVARLDPHHWKGKAPRAIQIFYPKKSVATYAMLSAIGSVTSLLNILHLSNIFSILLFLQQTDVEWIIKVHRPWGSSAVIKTITNLQWNMMLVLFMVPWLFYIQLVPATPCMTTKLGHLQKRSKSKYNYYWLW